MSILVPAAARRHSHALAVLTVELLLWSWVPDRVRAAATARLRPIGTWLWAARWRRVTIRAFVIWHVAGVLILAATAPARADSAKSVRDNPYLGWMTVKDSHGISIWRYFLSIDGGSASNKTAAFWSPIIKFEYEIYRGLAGAAIWCTGYVLSFEWLQLLIEPVRVVGDSVDALTNQLNLTSTLLTIAGAVGGYWILKGRWSTGIYEVIMAATIAALAVGVLSDPVERVAGSDGVIMQARDAGLELGAGLANNGNTNASPTELIDTIKAQMADTMVRQPTMLLNFGVNIDAMEGPNRQSCIEGFDRGFDDVKGNTQDTLKDNIRKCEGGGDNFWDSNGGSMKEWADNPGSSQAFAGWILIFGGGILFLFAMVLAASVVMAAGTALYQSVKAIVMLTLGIMSGMARNALFKTASNLAISLVVMVFGVVFTVGYMLVLQGFFASEGDNLIKKFLFVDAALLIGIFQFRRGVKGLRALSDGLAQRLGTRPGPAPQSIAKPLAPTSPLQSAYYAAQVAGQTLGVGKKVVGATASAGKGTVAVGSAAGKVAKVGVEGAVVGGFLVGKGVASVVQGALRRGGGDSGGDSSGKTDPPARSSVPVAGSAGGTGISPAVATAATGARPRPLTLSRSREALPTPSSVSGTFHEYSTPNGVKLALPVPRVQRAPRAVASDDNAASSTNPAVGTPTSGSSPEPATISPATGSAAGAA